MKQKLTLTYVRREEKVSPRTNKPYTSMSLKAKEHGDRYLSGFNSKETSFWKEGDVVEVEVVEAEAKDKEGRPYLNWKVIDKEQQLEERIANLEKQMREVVAHLNQKVSTGITSAGTPVPNFVPNTPEQEADYVKKMAEYDPINDVNADLNAIAEEEYNNR